MVDRYEWAVVLYLLWYGTSLASFSGRRLLYFPYHTWWWNRASQVYFQQAINFQLHLALAPHNVQHSWQPIMAQTKICIHLHWHKLFTPFLATVTRDGSGLTHIFMFQKRLVLRTLHQAATNSLRDLMLDTKHSTSSHQEFYVKCSCISLYETYLLTNKKHVKIVLKNWLSKLYRRRVH